MNPIEVKEKLEKDTGFKISMKVQAIKSSMKGYISFSIINTKRSNPEWSFEYKQLLSTFFEKPEPNPTFANRYRLDVYYGMDAYNYVKEKKVRKENTIKKPTHVQSVFVPKSMRNSNYFLGYTLNYGRVKGHNSKVKSAGWGISPNVVNDWYELNTDNVIKYAHSNIKLILGNGDEINKETFLKSNVKLVSLIK